MGNNNNKNKNQSTDEKKDKTQAQTVENQQTDAPAATDSGDTQPPVTPPADSGPWYQLLQSALIRDTTGRGENFQRA